VCFVLCAALGVISDDDDNRFYGAEVDDTYDKRLVQRLVDWLTRRGYTAHSLVLFQRLHPDYWYGWPDDIFWQHREADPFM